MDDVTRNAADNAPMVSTRTRALVWVACLAALGVTFFAYDQVALAVAWIVMKFC
jgi:hypothetical protein